MESPPTVLLFRREALDAKRPQALGDIVLLPGTSSRWIAWSALALVALLVVFIVLGGYTRRSTVVGVLHPRDGLIRIAVDQPGVIVEARVRDGDDVKAGQLLFVISGDRAGPSTAGFQRDMARQIAARGSSLAADLARLKAEEAQDIARVEQRMASLRAEGERARQQVLQQDLQVNVAADAVARYRGLHNSGYVSRDELGTREIALAGLRAQREGSQREALALQRETSAAQRDLDATRARYALQRGEFDRAGLLAQQELTELEAKRQVLVTAPTDGRVTLTRAEVGQSIEVQRPIAHIVPAADRLVARLQVPSRAVGFVQTGTQVTLRYDAFPYQKFGQQRGSVSLISVAAVSQGQLATQGQRADPAAEALYDVVVELPAQTIADDPTLRLQAGMRVEADLLHERRRIYEWVLEPLMAARARVIKG